MKNILPSVARSVLLLCLAAACVPSAKPSVHIGLIAPFEGRYREIGQEVIYAVRLAVREANAAGGVGGYTIELTSLDDVGDSNQAAAQAVKLATDPQMVGVIGNWLDHTTAAAAPVLADSGIAHLATTTAPLPPSAFRLWHASQAVAPPYCDGCDLPTLIAWFEDDCRDHARCIGSPLAGMLQFPRLAPQLAEDTVFAAPAPLPSHSADADFAARYRNISHGVEPRFFAVLAYDGARLLLAAIESDIAANGAPTRAGVTTALARVSLDGLSGDLSFDSAHNRRNNPVWLYRWRDGQLAHP